jgi:tRNA(Ile)-lysidine synthase
MQTKVIHVLRNLCSLNPGDTLLVGVSGGPDSITLLDLLTKLDFHIIVAHLDHQLRFESSIEATRVRSFAEGLNLSCIVGSEDTRAYSQQQALSIEEAARELRYKFLFEHAESRKAKAVLVAHHADDQVETVLMHILRGAGLSGLGGMSYRSMTNWHDEIPLIRPMLGIWRDEIESYCEENELEPVIDTSNMDTTFFRNRLRHELIPRLEDYNPRVRSLILQMSDTLREDHAILASLTEEILKKCLVESSPQHIAVNTEAFSAQPLGLQRYLIRLVISKLRPGLRDIGFQDVKRALQFINKPPKSNQADLVAGLRLQIEADRFIIADWNAELLHADWPQWSGKTLKLAVPGVTKLDKNWRVVAKMVPKKHHFIEMVSANSDPFTAYFDIDPLVTPLTIHTRQPGDRMTPLGMTEGSVKVGDLMINSKLPRRARLRWPLVFVAGRVVWVPGVRQSAQYAVRETTETILKVSFEMKE